jgi:hypothetical protein
MFLLVLKPILKDQNGEPFSDQDAESGKYRSWVIRHGRGLELLALSMVLYVYYDTVNHQKNESKSIIK